MTTVRVSLVVTIHTGTTMYITFNMFVFTAVHLQRAPTSGAVLPSGSASWLLNGASGLSQSLQVTQQKLRLHSLQLERERLKSRQQEIIRQVITAAISILTCRLCISQYNIMMIHAIYRDLYLPDLNRWCIKLKGEGSLTF